MNCKTKTTASKDINNGNFDTILFSVSKGDRKGEVNLQWDPVLGARFYIVQICGNTQMSLKWTQIDIITKSRYTIMGLRSGKTYCFRISAVTSSGQRPWSKIIKKNAP